MTSRRSLSKKKGAAYSFFTGLSTAAAPAILTFAVQAVLMAVLPLTTFIRANKDAAEDITHTEKTAREIWKFFVFGDPNVNKALVYPILVILGVLAILTAVFMFRFICDKKTVNVYYSLGIKRSTLFLTKYAAGALLLAAGTALSVILSYTVNAAFLGASWQLSAVLFHFYCGLSLFLLMCYSAAAVVFASVGTISEAIIYSAGLLFAPTVFFFGLQQICTAFLKSAVFSKSIIAFDAVYSWNGNNTPNMIEKFSTFNPILFFSGDLTKYSVAKPGADGKINLSAVNSVFEMPDFFKHIPIFIITAVLAVLAVVLFRKLKAENCGFLNTNKVFSNMIIFEVCLAVSTLWLPDSNQKTLTALLIGAGAAFVCYIIIEIFLKRNFKAILKTVYKFAAHMAVIGIICSVAATGAFGFETRIPNIDKVKTASVALPVAVNSASLKTAEAINYLANGVANVLFLWSLREMPEMTDKNDIKVLMDIHKRITEKGQDFSKHGIDIYVNYGFINGKEMRRKLHISDKQTMASLFALYDTSSYKQALYDLFYKQRTPERLKEITSKDVYENRSEISEYCFEYDYSEVIARSPSLQDNRTLNLTREQFYALKDNVYKDLSAMNGNELFSCSYQQTGVLSFKVNGELFNPDGMDAIVQEEEEEIPQDYKEIYGEDYKDVNFAPYVDFGGKSNSFTSSYDVVINANMVNTINYLYSIGFPKCFESSEIEAISFIKCDYDAFHAYDYHSSDIVKDFYSYTIEPKGYDRYKNADEFLLNFQNDYSQNIITDKEQLTKLTPLLSLHRFTFDEGYYAIVKYKNAGTFTVHFIPEQWAPDFVRNYPYTFTDNYFI